MEVINKYNVLKMYLAEKEANLKELETKHKEKVEKKELLEKAAQLLRLALDSLSSKVSIIERLISSALTDVFGIPYEFKLQKLVGNDGTLKGFKPKISEDGGPFEDPLLICGTGANSLISVLLKMSTLLMFGKTQRIMILDEAFANVAKELTERFIPFLTNICKDSNLQLIMTTHTIGSTGTVYSVSKNKYSKVTKIEDNI
jgi:hypothetical protein